MPQPSSRRVRRRYAGDLDLVWNRSLPELACAANALSLLMPHVEPFVVRSTRAALPLLDPALRERTGWYLQQEAGHQRQHQRFNDLVVQRYPAVRRVERAAGAAYRWVEARSDLHRGVAFAAGFEAVAFASARWVDRRAPELFGAAQPAAAELFLWHLAEEVEHKRVAFDVRQALGVRRATAALQLVLSLLLMAVFTLAATVVLLAAERRLHHPVAWARLARWSVSYAFEVLPLLAVSLLPGHHPDQLVDPPWLALWLAEHDAAAAGSSRPAGSP